MKDLFPNTNGHTPGKKEHLFGYYGENGKLLFQVVREELPDGRKTFKQRRPDGNGGFIWTLEGVRRVPYRLPHILQETNAVVIFHEGEKAVEAAVAAVLPGVHTTTAGGANAARKTDFSAVKGREVIVCPDNDEPGERYVRDTGDMATAAGASCVKVLRLPGLPPKGDVVEWLQAGGTPEQFKALLTQSELVTPSADTPEAQEPEVVPLDDVSFDEFPLEAFPEPLRTMIDGVAKATETPVELAAMMGLATVAASCQQAFEVTIDSGYSEPLNLWAVAALESGNRKTAVHRTMTEPLRVKERELCEQSKSAIAHAESQRATMEARVKALRGRIANSEDIGDFEQEQQEIDRLLTEMPDVPIPPRLWAQDVTPEKMGALMADNNERLALLSDEGGIFDILAGRYSNGVPNLDTFLQSHAGAPVRVDRGSRPPIVMHRPVLSMGLSPQPGVLRGLTGKSGFRDRGLLARFLYVLPASRLGYRTLKTEPVPPGIRTAYTTMVTALLAFEPTWNEHGETMPITIRLSPEANQEWREFAELVELNMRPEQPYEHLKDWAGKLPGAALRVAGLFHCVQYAQRQPQAVPISLETMTAAVNVLAVLGQHAIAAFDLMGADPALEGARKVWRWISLGHRHQITARQCFQALKGSFSRMAELDASLSILCERGYVHAEEDHRSGPGRRSRRFTVNQTITKEWV
ncbi:MAG: DUF3987 domain-containing protein [Nitrospira sp. BO4]|jgi:hypothetical protein|nr:DUF3987 domain-containing protein [Nitrospira sp. BO4]